MSDKKPKSAEVHLAEISINLTTLAKDMAEIKTWIKPIQTHVTQVQTGLKLFKWLCGSGLIGAVVVYLAKM